MFRAAKSLSPFLGLLAFGIVSILLAVPASAQTAGDAKKIVADLPAPAREAIDRLSHLHELPGGQWRIHPGDLAHGEAVSLDESSWKAIAPGEKATKDAVWFRQTFTVPKTLQGYDLTGARIWFQFHAYANGPMPEILYFNGRRVALGDDLEPVVLFDSAKPGDTVVVAIKLLHTVDTKTFGGATLKIDFPESRPNPEDIREELLSATLLVPALAPGDRSKLDTLIAAIETVDVKALDAAEASDAEASKQAQAKFDASLVAARTKLEALRPLLEQVSFHLTGNSHIDAAWLWPWTETVDVVKRTFSTALQLMYEYPSYTYSQSAAAYNEWLAQKYPDINAEIARRIKEGRWEIVGGMWVEPDLNMPDGESLVRQLLVGKRWFRQQYGVDVRIGWNPDSFGYTWQLPQIYKKSGVDYFVTQKMAWCDTNQLPFKFFWWQSPDGSKVLAYFPHDYANGDLNPVRLARDYTIAQKQATGLPAIMDLYGIGDHGGGPTRAILDEGNHWANSSSTTAAANPTGSVTGHDFSRADDAAKKEDGALAPATAANSHVFPKMEFGTAQSYFTEFEKKIAPQSPVWDYRSIAKGYTAPAAVPGMVSIPTWKSELYFEYHRGVMTTQANHKRNMREAEVNVLNAEKWASLAWLDGKAYPADELTEDWKKVLFNQFHDTAAGSGIGVIYKDAAKDYDVVRYSTNDIDAGALGTIMDRIDTAKGNPTARSILVFNSLGWDRPGEIYVRLRRSPADEGDPRQGPELFTGSDGKALIGRVLHYDPSTKTEDVAIRLDRVPALGYMSLRVDAENVLVSEAEKTSTWNIPELKESHWKAAKDFNLENDTLRVKFGEDGCITSIFNKRTSIEFLPAGACANQLQAFKDLPKDYDAWNIDPGTLDQQPVAISQVDSMEWTTDGTTRVRITRHWKNSKFVQTIRLQGDLIDIDNDIDWHESHVLLKAAFPLAATSDFATYEIPYGAIDRPTTRNTSWEKAQFEVPAMRWADLGGKGADGKVHGLSVINNSKYGYDAVGNLLRLTLLRSPKWPDAEADMGHHHFHYALYPHAGTWKDALTVRHGYEFNYPLTAVVTTAHAGSLPPAHSFISVGPENVVLTAVKKAEDAKGLILRMYEWAGKDSTVEIHLPAGATGATVTNMQETPEGAPLKIEGDVLKAAIHPYEILTLRVDYPNGGPRE